VPLGTFYLSKVGFNDAADGVTVSLTGYGVSRAISRAKWEHPFTIPAGTTGAAALAMIAADRVPGTTVDAAACAAVLPQLLLGLAADGDPWADLVQIATDNGCEILISDKRLFEWVRLFWSDLIVSVRNCPATICGGGRGMAGVLQPAATCSNSSRDRPNTPAASLLLLRIPLAPLLSHVLVSTPTNVAGRSPSNDQVRHKTPGHTRRRPHSRGAAPFSNGPTPMTRRACREPRPARPRPWPPPRPRSGQ
jgi:hypothetical protein